MSYYDTIFLVKGDDKPDINLSLKDSNTAKPGFTLDPTDSDTWGPIDLTDVVVTVNFRLLGSTLLLDTLSCINVGPFTAGVTDMSWNLTTLDVDPGTYEGEIVLTYTSGRIQTLYDKLKFKIRDDF